MMTDVHSHILPYVDDGSSSLEDSLSLVETLALQGVDKIFLTPHYKKGRFSPDVNEVKLQFEKFSNAVEERGLNVKLYLGEEVFCDDEIYDLIKNKQVLSLNNTNYMLIEFDYFNYCDISDYVYNLKTMGIIPIIAHIERYSYLDVGTLLEAKRSGALIQVNASSVTGESGKKVQKKVLATIKSGLVDFIATDIHYKRKASLQDAYKVIQKKFGTEVADNLLENNSKILNT